ADEVRFTSTTAGETLTINAGDTGIEIAKLSDASGTTTGTTQLNINASADATGITLTGNDGVNTLTGSSHVDTINGGAGADVIDGGAGTDVIDGGTGNDIYIVSAGSDHGAAEFADTGADSGDTIRFTSTTGADTLTIAAGDTGIENIVVGDATGATTGTSQL